MIHVIYSTATGRIRRIDQNAPPLLTGESHTTFAESFLLQDFPSQQGTLNQQTGLTPANDRYAIIDSIGNVVGAIVADPLCGDAIPNHQLVAHATAGPGWTYAAGIFTAPVTVPGPPKVIVNTPVKVA